MKVFEILAILKTLKFRDKWHKGVLTYAVEMVEKLCNGDQEDVTKDTEYSEISIGHVTHHSDGFKFKASDRTNQIVINHLNVNTQGQTTMMRH